MVVTLVGVAVLGGVAAGSAAFYLLPVLVGWARHVPDLGALAVIDVLLGWTLVAWVVALAMALRSATPVGPVVQLAQNPPLSSLPPGQPPYRQARHQPGGRVQPGHRHCAVAPRRRYGAHPGLMTKPKLGELQQPPEPLADIGLLATAAQAPHIRGCRDGQANCSPATTSCLRKEPRMNRYGLMARTHWERWLPAQYAAIEDPDSFFSDLGSRAEARIDELADELAGEDRPGEGYLAKAGRLGQARRTAQEIVLTDMILLDPEPGADEDQEEPPPPPERPVIVTRTAYGTGH